ncbi:TPA: hypothetical protein SMO99_001417 [Proteus mirabilis]|uniref:hypothetical protein n=1 Tax=Enterobacterales TaxID=91347 RepID=UPI00073B6BE2|nr:MULTISPECIES: hypothetical protein [Enterobacterales]NBN50808.1 hypothetical protein [Proteus sp. G4415]ELZ9636310.1 hypothetical protein [Proteus mirabilis]KSW17542.1 lipoprotein [Proteus mirabilis]MBG2799103.1 hypothetical protein [Proteus mirabilis]MBG2995950.1 hypothetical protein [Proteus mirabilis]
MWIKLIKKLPWRELLLFLIISGFLAGVYHMGYTTGHDAAARDGVVAVNKLQSEFNQYRRVQAERENAALKAWAARYQAQVAAGQQAGADYLEQIAQLKTQNQQLQGKINDVTQRWMDEKGKSHPIKCVFTRGFVRRYNAALGYDNASADTGRSDSGAAAGTGTGTTSWSAEAADSRLRDSGVTQQDILANLIDNATQCRIWRTQINALLDEREGLQQ